MFTVRPNNDRRWARVHWNEHVGRKISHLLLTTSSITSSSSENRPSSRKEIALTGPNYVAFVIFIGSKALGLDPV